MENDRNRKLRLIVTDNCHNSCPKCCNRQYDMASIPIVDRIDYEEILITGGEPMLFPSHVHNLSLGIRNAARELRTINPKIYVYTAQLRYVDFWFMNNVVDGYCVTPHSKSDVRIFKALNKSMQRYVPPFVSMRLNIFPEVKELLKDEDLSRWKVKEMDWQEKCPVPKGEDLRRISSLWRMPLILKGEL